MSVLTTDKGPNPGLFPAQIKVSGLPFMLQGWNAKYYKTSDTSDGCPTYRLEPYNLYKMIAIIGVTIKRINGGWVLQRDCDLFPTSMAKYGANPQGDPFGEWSNGMKVNPVS